MIDGGRNFAGNALQKYINASAYHFNWSKYNPDMSLDRALLQLQPDIIIAKLRTSSISREAALCQFVDSIQKSASELDITTSKGTSAPAPVSVNYNSSHYLSHLLGSFRYHWRRYSLFDRQIVGGASRKQETEETVALYWAPSWVCHSESLVVSMETLSCTVKHSRRCTASILPIAPCSFECIDTDTRYEFR